MGDSRGAMCMKGRPGEASVPVPAGYGGSARGDTLQEHVVGSSWGLIVEEEEQKRTKWSGSTSGGGRGNGWRRPLGQRA